MADRCIGAPAASPAAGVRRRPLLVLPAPIDAHLAFRLLRELAADWEPKNGGRKLTTGHMETTWVDGLGRALVVWDQPVDQLDSVPLDSLNPPEEHDGQSRAAAEVSGDDRESAAPGVHD